MSRSLFLVSGIAPAIFALLPIAGAQTETVFVCLA
jgi:hypothetical protein